MKAAGNKAFEQGNFEEAIDLYTKAIDQQSNHVYFANRANAYLELRKYAECIADCDKAIAIEPSYSKSYFRKAKALFDS